MQNFISDDDVEKALDWLRDNADNAAKARANKIYLAEFRKTLKAQLMKESPKESAVIQERNAYADPRYVEHLKALHEAIMRDARFEWLRSAAEAKQEAWRTASSNVRAMKL